MDAYAVFSLRAYGSVLRLLIQFLVTLWCEAGGLLHSPGYGCVSAAAPCVAKTAPDCTVLALLLKIHGSKIRVYFWTSVVQ